MRNAMSLKAKIRNIAKEKNIPAQVILQNYLFERLLVRLSASAYRGTAAQIANIPEILASIAGSSALRAMWGKYRRQFAYASAIEYEQIMEILEKLTACASWPPAQRPGAGGRSGKYRGYQKNTCKENPSMV